MARKNVLIVLLSFCFLFFVSAAMVTAQDDMELPPPPDADEDLSAPPPPDMGMDDMPPPPDEGGDDMPPPPEEAGSDDMPPPPEEEGDELAPPDEGEMASEELAPPPGDEGEEAAEEEASITYRVARGDSLWRISGKRSIYNDSFMWPLIYKANKATIEDPDLIYPKQKLDVKKDYPQNVVEDAVDKAKETPPYEPHTMPRKKLPIKY
jgi:hypothetical protein